MQMNMSRLTQEERDLVLRIRSKWTEICNGLMHFTGSMRPLLMLEFQGYLDYLKVIEKKIAFWEIKNLDINHKVSAYHWKHDRILELHATATLEIYLPGKIGEVSIYLTYFSDEERDRSSHRWEAIICEINEREHDDD